MLILSPQFDLIHQPIIIRVHDDTSLCTTDIMNSGYKENEALPTVNFKLLGRFALGFDPYSDPGKVMLVGIRNKKISLMIIERSPSNNNS